MQNLLTNRNWRRAADPAPELSGFDPLTGLATRKLFQFRLDQQWEHARKAHRPLGLLLINFDHLRQFRQNNHKAKVNAALIESARILSDACRRRADFACRMRSGEFAALLTEIKPEGLGHVAELVRRGIELAGIPMSTVADSDSDSDVLTVSVGALGVVPPPSHFAHTLLIGADQALKDAKEAGRNRVELASHL